MALDASVIKINDSVLFFSTTGIYHWKAICVIFSIISASINLSGEE